MNNKQSEIDPVEGMSWTTVEGVELTLVPSFGNCFYSGVQCHFFNSGCKAPRERELGVPAPSCTSRTSDQDFIFIREDQKLAYVTAKLKR